MSKAAKPTLARGTRDFLPQVVLRRRHILGTISTVFEQYGYQPIETPAMENLATLMGKYGDEGDKLLFRILDNGDFLKDAPAEARHDSDKLAPFIAEKALKYDLTVPFARFVVMHQNELTFPFKRYQIQPVWRADRPQRGRYREFTQCDADAVGSNSLVLEAEFIHMYAQVFHTLGVPVRILINNRKVLAGIAAHIGAPELLVAFTVALDKLDKIGREAVEAEWRERGFTDAQVAALAPVFGLDADAATALSQLREWLGHVPEAAQGIQELADVLQYAAQLPADYPVNLQLDVTLARGLNYYTGTILEVKPAGTDFQSSIGGGGRYDNLTAAFGGRDLSGVGISFGVDRIYDVMEELEVFPQNAAAGPWVMVVNFGKETLPQHLQLAHMLRGYGVSCELYPDAGTKLGKQFSYADSRGVRYVLVQGPDEIARNEVKVKDMRTGTEQTHPMNMIRSLFAPGE